MLLLLIILSTLIIALYAAVVLTFYVKLKLHTYNREYKGEGLSVVIPYRDEEENLQQLLQCLDDQDFPREKFEVLLVNDQSSDKSVDIAKDWLKKTQLNARLFSTSAEGGKKKALATGIKNANFPLILQTDADCVMHENWISNSVAPMKEEGIIAALGVVKMSSDGLMRGLFSLEFLSLQACGAALSEMNIPVLSNGANLIYRREDWLEAEQKHTKWAGGDDVFFIQNLVKSGKGKIPYNFQSIVETPSVKKGGEFINQRVRWGAKTPDYPLQMGIWLAVLIVVVSFLLIGLIALSGIYPDIWKLAVSAWLVKGLVDWTLLYRFASLSGQKKLLRWYIPAWLLYPFYILVSTALILLAESSFKWKGRELRKH